MASQPWTIERAKGAYHGVEVALGILLHRPPYQWRIKLTFYYSLSTADGKASQIMRLASLLDFDRIDLLHDTVTELAFSPSDPWEGAVASQVLPLREAPPPQDGGAAAVRFPDDVRMYVREDPRRVFFPHYTGPTVRTQESHLKRVRDIHSAISLVETRLPEDEDRAEEPRPYIYKRIERNMYWPVDTEAITQELRNLETIGNAEFIIRLAAAVVSPNPYHTDLAHPERADEVLRGFLVEYHPAGTLEHALHSPEASIRPWRRWALQMALGLQRVHEAGIAHMDVKPSNWVVDAEQNMVLIDICGIGYTRPWLAPEMLLALEQDDLELDDLPFAARVQNDIWAYGKLLLTMAQRCPEGADREALERAGAGATATPLRGVVLDLARSIADSDMIRLRGLGLDMAEQLKHGEDCKILGLIGAMAPVAAISRISLIDVIAQLGPVG